MANLFDIREMLKMAVREEHTGRDYYSFLSKSAQRGGVRELAERLAGIEEHHERLFSELLDSLGDYQPVEDYPGEYGAYLEALMEGRMFPEENRAAFMIEAAGKDDLSAVNIALLYERSTLFLFREIESYVPNRERERGIREVIERIVGEEKQHLVDLSLMKNKLRGT